MCKCAVCGDVLESRSRWVWISCLFSEQYLLTYQHNAVYLMFFVVNSCVLPDWKSCREDFFIYPNFKHVSWSMLELMLVVAYKYVNAVRISMNENGICFFVSFFKFVDSRIQWHDNGAGEPSSPAEPQFSGIRASVQQDRASVRSVTHSQRSRCQGYMSTYWSAILLVLQIWNNSRWCWVWGLFVV